MQPISLNTQVGGADPSANRSRLIQGRSGGSPLPTNPGADGSPATGQVAMSAAGSDSMQTVSVVYSRVETMLASFGNELAADQQLRMIIALLILNALLGGDDEQNSGNRLDRSIGLMAGLEALGRRGEVAQFSATNIIQIRHQSTLVYTEQAVQTTARTADQPRQPGSEGSSGLTTPNSQVGDGLDVRA